MNVGGTERSLIYSEGPDGKMVASSEDRDWEQPFLLFARWWLYHHLWERVSYRAWVALDDRLPGLDTPLYVRQDLRCFGWKHVRRVYGDPL